MTRAPAPANGRCCWLDTGCYVPDSLSHWRSLPQFNPLYRDAPESPRGGALGWFRGAEGTPLVLASN
jgi:hypothetical protein